MKVINSSFFQIKNDNYQKIHHFLYSFTFKTYEMYQSCEKTFMKYMHKQEKEYVNYFVKDFYKSRIIRMICGVMICGVIVFRFS